MIIASDGITELKNSNGKLFGTNGLTDLVSKYGHLSDLNDVFSHFKSDLDIFSGNALQLDDITVALVKYKPGTNNTDEHSTAF